MELRVSERQIHIAVVQWLEMNHIKNYCHVPNGEVRSLKTGALLKRLGVKRGVPDLLFFEPRGGFTGFALELKASRGRLSAEQIEWLRVLKESGWKIAVTFSVEEAVNEVRNYFRL